jgi:opacity protein-like surface antigen
VLWLSVSASAQAAPKVELFGGYSYTRIDQANRPSLNANGWTAAASITGTRHVGVTIDFSGHYTTPFNTSPLVVDADTGRVRLYRALFGPRLTGRTRVATTFLHALFGVAWGEFEQRSFGRTVSRLTKDSFAIAVGGGIDINVHDNLAIRPFQAEYAPTHFKPFFENRRQHNLRIGAGIVVRLGR